MIPPVVSILTALHEEGYAIRLTFDDGTEQRIDFGPFLFKSLNPDIHRWLDPEAFASFRVEQGDLVWGDWELCFPIADLYRGRI